MNDSDITHSFHHEAELSGVVIRPFDIDTDLNGAFQCFEEGFRHILWPLFDQADLRLSLDLIRLFHLISPDSWAAEVNGEIHGILFGAIPIRPYPACRAFSFAVSRILPGILLNSYHMKSLARRHLFQLMFSYLPLVYLHPHQLSLPEITLFTTRRQYRGKGLGKRLMDIFIRETAKRRKKEAFVCTDTSLSYWFYERYGFHKIRTFPMKGYRYSLPGIKHQFFIYRYDMRPR